MKIFIELPTWLGDTVMLTPSIEIIADHFTDAKITLLGSNIAIQALKSHPKVVKTYTLEKSYIYLYKNIKKYGGFDFFFSFRSSFRSKFIKFLIISKYKYQFDKAKYNNGHQVEKYNSFINDSLDIKSSPSNLIIHHKNNKKRNKKKLLGINPGASYGSAKRWYPEKFAAVAYDLSSEYDIIIFGGTGEKNISQDIESALIKKNIKNFVNLVGKTSISELMSQISNLDLFITGDSGPMHLAAAFQIPTVAIFGPTNDLETSQWMNKKSTVIKQSFNCQPCMKRKCPLKHHNCMKEIQVSEVIKAVKELN
jgi:heptosyltransferase II